MGRSRHGVDYIIFHYSTDFCTETGGCFVVRLLAVVRNFVSSGHVDFSNHSFGTPNVNFVFRKPVL